MIPHQGNGTIPACPYATLTEMSVEQFVAVLGGFTALLVAIGTLLVQVRSLRQQVDGRLTELLSLTRSSSRAEGALDERENPRQAP